MPRSSAARPRREVSRRRRAHEDPVQRLRRQHRLPAPGRPSRRPARPAVSSATAAFRPSQTAATLALGVLCRARGQVAAGDGTGAHDADPHTSTARPPLQRPLARERHRERPPGVGRRAERPASRSPARTASRKRAIDRPIGSPCSLESACPPRDAARRGTPRARTRGAIVDVGGEDVGRVELRLAVARPGRMDRADRAAREVQNEDDRVGDRPGLGLCQADRPGQRLDRRHLARQRPLEVDVVAAALEDLPAALGLVHEPRPAGHRAEVPADEHARSAARGAPRAPPRGARSRATGTRPRRPPGSRSAAATIASASASVRAIGFSR